MNVAMVVAILDRLRARAPRWGTVVRTAALAGLGLDLVAALVHLLTGHRPGSPSALTGIGFLAEHPALLIVGVLGLAALWLSRPTAGAPSSRRA